MIIGRIKGGLGNQMFIYSFIYYLAKKFNTDFSFDISDYIHNFDKRNLLINNFKIEFKICKESILKNFRNNSNFKYYEKFKSILRINPFNSNIINENKYLKISRFDNLNIEEFYFDGYWQDIKYFQKNYEILNNNFKLKKESMSENYFKIKNKIINNSHSVAMHVRKGDYLIKKNTDIYENITKSYYENSVDYFKNNLPNNKLYIFSDDTNWVKNNLNFKDSILISKYNLNTIEEFDLLSNFKNIVLSNSTFSLWASLLNNKNNKIIITPKYWFKKNNSERTNKLFTNDMVILNN